LRIFRDLIIIRGNHARMRNPSFLIVSSGTFDLGRWTTEYGRRIVP
jgi:hypothetical protein